jgi:hypothetical protein
MKKCFVLIALFVVCVFALGAVAADAAVIYGIQHHNSATANIYKIDMNTCDRTLMASTTLNQAPGSSWNGNAYDIVNDRYYFTQFDDQDRYPKILWMLDNFSTSPTLVQATDPLQPLSERVSNGTFYNGKYYYMGHKTDNLWEVTFNADGTVASEVQLTDIGNKTWYFGDIAYGMDGILYGSVAQTTYNNNPEFFTWDGTTYTSYMATGAPEALQIAFGDDGVLYGYAIFNDNKFYAINTADGTLTEKCTSPMDFSDLAGAINPVAPPDINIKPGSDPNSINACSGGATPVTIWGSETFDVTTIDVNQLIFASANVKTVGKSGKSLCSIEDVGAPDEAYFDKLDPLPDGYPDLTCHFITHDLGLNDASPTADISITGCDDGYNSGCTTTSTGYYEVTATDSINIVKDCE